MASSAGVALVVGPLTRDDLKTVIAMAPERPRMLALNQTDDGAPLPRDTYALSLAVDSDAVVLAQAMRSDGVRSPVKVVSASPLQRRFASAFGLEWERSGGQPMREYVFDPNPEALGALRRELTARQPDAILLAVDGQDAALAKAFLPPAPVYASSQITDGLPPEMLRDLEGVRYVEIPWLATPDAPSFAGIPRGPASDPLSVRLYALGLDAFALAQMLVSPTPPDRIEIDGATGHLSLSPTRNFVRQGTLMMVRGGRITAYTAPP
jgi:outer membrane PBP1 activator LpoA protein